MQRNEGLASGGWQTKQSLTLLPDLARTSGGWQTKQSLTLLPDLVKNYMDTTDIKPFTGTLETEGSV